MTSPFAVGGSVPPGGGTARLSRGKAEPRYGKVRRGAIDRLGRVGRISDHPAAPERHQPLAPHPFGPRHAPGPVELRPAVRRMATRLNRDATSYPICACSPERAPTTRD